MFGPVGRRRQPLRGSTAHPDHTVFPGFVSGGLIASLVDRSHADRSRVAARRQDGQVDDVVRRKDRRELGDGRVRSQRSPDLNGRDLKRRRSARQDRRAEITVVRWTLGARRDDAFAQLRSSRQWLLASRQSLGHACAHASPRVGKSSGRSARLGARAASSPRNRWRQARPRRW